MTQQGIRQFLDIGAGLPTQENVHQVALRHAPDSRVVYVDNDPIVLVHARALLADEKRVVAVEGDLRRPESILDNPEVTQHIDFGQPVGLLLVAVLHFIPDEAAYPAVAKLRDRLAPGSHLVISHGSVSRDLNEDVIEKGKEIYARSSAGMAIPRSREEILRFFDGFELVEPGLVPGPTTGAREKTRYGSPGSRASTATPASASSDDRRSRSPGARPSRPVPAAPEAGSTPPW